MDSVELEIIEKFGQLDFDAKQRVLESLTEVAKSDFDYDAWFRRVQGIREEISADHGGEFPQIDAIEMLREIRNGEDK